MTLSFVRNLIIQTLCNVTGDDLEEIQSAKRVKLDTRDWEQVFGRLEASLDLVTGELTSARRTLDIDALARAIHRRLADTEATA